MAYFRYVRRKFYDGLDMEVSLRLNAYRQVDYTAQAWVKVIGQPGLRERWRKEFWEWATTRDLDAFAPRYGNRRSNNASSVDCYLKNWQVVADFLVMWVGIEALSEALSERESFETRVGSEVKKLAETVDSMVGSVQRLENSALQNGHMMQAVGLSLLANGSTKRIS